MCRLKTIYFTLCVVLCYFQAQGADKYTDENRPYEFGFTINGEQHRHEKKDENGIIMGEFGFITADGVYHVTVYATDENGNFKIISMKNIRVKPYPTAPTTRNSAERKGHSLPLPAAQSQQLSTPQTYNSVKTQQIKQENSSPLRSCSHCKLPTTTTTTTPTPRPKLASSTVLSTNNYNNKPLQITGNSQSTSNYQKSSQNYNSKQYENSLSYQQSAQPNFEQNYQQGSVSSQSYQGIPSPGQNYPNEAVNVYNQEPVLQSVPSQQNYPQDDFNVGRKYLQKAQGQQNYHQQTVGGPNSLAQSNYRQEFNAEQQKQQGIIDGQYNLQPPYANQNDQQRNPGSYPKQATTNVQDFGTPKLGQNYPSSNTEQNYVQGPNTNSNKYIQNNNYQNQPIRPGQAIDTSLQGTTPGDRQPKTFTDILQMAIPPQQYNSNSYASSQQNIKKPVLLAAQMQIVNKNTDIYHKNPGETEGLPKGLTTGDMTELLYTFNYTVGFHGHHEEGYRSGAKIGYYYVTGRNGIRTRVDYVADETGFHPRISQEVLDIQSEEVPKPETEKDEKYGLKGYEFKWLYYPIDSK